MHPPCNHSVKTDFYIYHVLGYTRLSFNEYSAYVFQGIPHQQLYWRKLECAALRDGDWKLIHIENLDLALYNVKDDIAEQDNLAGKFPERVRQMEKMLKKWEIELTDPWWKEGAIWTKVRYEYHKAWFETGKPPSKKKK